MKLLTTISVFSIILTITACSNDSESNLENLESYQRVEADWLTHEEAILRKKTISQVKYALQIDLTKSERYTGTIDIQFDYKPSKFPVTVDFVGGEAERVLVNRKPISIDYNGNFLIIPSKHLDSGSNTIKIQYSHAYSDNGSGLYRYEDPLDKRVYLYTYFEPYDSNKLFPSFDQPNLRATYKVKVIAPKDWTVVTSNRESNVVLDGPYRRWEFPESSNFSTYIFPLHAGPWHIWEGNAGKVPLRLMARESLADLVDVREWLKITQNGFKFYEQYFAMPYPYEKYDQLIVPDFNIGGMENVGAVTYTESYVPRGEASERRKQNIANTILHELSHMWFGDLVTIDWWNALWLKESFASYMAPLALSEATKYKNAWQAFNTNTKQNAYIADQQITTHPIDMEVLDTKSGDASFDAITYNKGASVLQQLAYYLGEESFRDGIRSYLKSHKNQAATLPDFINSLKKTSGKELDNWTESWINTAGVNTLMADYQCHDGRITEFKIQQSASKDYPQLRSHRIQIGLYQKNQQQQMVASRVVPTTISGKTTDIKTLIGLDCPLLVYPNHGDWGYLKVQLDEKTLLILPESITSIQDDLLRAMFWQSLWDMVRDLQMPLTQYLELTLQSINYERNPENISLLLENIKQAHHWLIKNTANTKAQQLLLEIEMLTLQQIQDQKEGSEFQKIWFSAFLNIAKSEESLDHLSLWLQGRSAPQILTSDQDRRWKALIALSRYNHPDTIILLNREKRQDTSDNGLMMAMAVEASNANLEIKQYWLDELMRKEQRQSAARLKNAMTYLFPPNQTKLHQQFAEKIIENLHYLDRHRGQVLVEHMVTNILPNLCSQDSVDLLYKTQNTMSTLGLIAQKGIRIAHQKNQRCVNINKMLK